MRIFPKKRIKINKTNIFNCNSKGHNELLKYGIIKISGQNNNICIGVPNYLKTGQILISGNNNTVIIPPNCYGGLKLEIKADNCTFTVGEKTGFMGTEVAMQENNSKIIVGSDCIIAKETRIYCSDFHAIIDLDKNLPFNQGKEIVIGNHVWLGEGVKILKNTHITDNVIIGTNSLVTKDLNTSNALYAGTPATLKKTNVNWMSDPFDLALKKLKKDNN